MSRVTISLDSGLAEAFDDFVARHGYDTRSEALRDLIRHRLESERIEKGEAGWCMATVSYVYNHHERDLARRMATLQHHHHDLALSTMHVHLDHDECLEIVVLKGRTASVRELADALVAERGVRHGAIHLVPLARVASSHGGGRHIHYHPVT